MEGDGGESTSCMRLNYVAYSQQSGVTGQPPQDIVLDPTSIEFLT